MKNFKKTNQFFVGLITLCLSVFLVISCSTEAIDDVATASNETTTNLAAKNQLANVTTKQSWADSFSQGGKCYCKSTYDHGIGNVKVGNKTVRQICEAMKSEMRKAEKRSGKKYYNTVQCGHAPAHKDKTIKGADGKKHADEVLCPGEVGSGIKCNSRKGPKWGSTSTPAPNPPTSSGGPSGFSFAANEGGTVKISSGTYDVAYGANGKFRYKRNVKNNIGCKNGVFGDPIPGVKKKCYSKKVSSTNPNPTPTPPTTGGGICNGVPAYKSGVKYKNGQSYVQNGKKYTIVNNKRKYIGKCN